MTNFSELHPIQGRILREFLYHPERRFSELNLDGVPSDQFSFHLKRLTELTLVRKNDKGHELTPAGKEFANRFDSETKDLILEKQAKLGALICCVRGEECLMQQRLKQPYYGYHGFITGKIKWGESVYETAEREFSEETGLSAKLTFLGVEHKIDYAKTGELLEDKYFFIFRGDDPKGALQEKFHAGRNLWIKMDEVAKMPDLHGDVPAILEVVRERQLRMWEQKFEVERY